MSTSFGTPLALHLTQKRTRHVRVDDTSTSPPTVDSTDALIVSSSVPGVAAVEVDAADPRALVVTAAGALGSAQISVTLPALGQPANVYTFAAQVTALPPDSRVIVELGDDPAVPA